MSEGITSEDKFLMNKLMMVFQEDELQFISPLLWHINGNKDTLSWVLHSGEILYNGEKIANSNIFDFLKSTLVELGESWSK